MINNKIKSILTISLVIMMLVWANIGSSPKNAMAQNTSVDNNTSGLIEKETLEKRTSGYILQFIDGNFNDFYKACSEQLQLKITEEALKQSWDDLIVRTGQPKGVISSTYSQKNALNSVEVKIEATLYNLITSIVYSDKGEPVSMWTNIIPKDPPTPQSTEKWKEIPVVVGEKKLPGMLTLPKGAEKPPVVIMIQGSGASDMNEAFGVTPNRPFEDIAHGLADQGVATLRYNKSIYQYPAGIGDTIEYEVLEDAAAAVKMLGKDKRIDTDRIYLLGHSLGGMLAPKITSDNPQIKGFVSMAGTLRSYQDIGLDQTKALIMVEASLTEQQKEDFLVHYKAELDRTKKISDSDTGYILGLSANYWRSLNAINSRAIVKKLKVPMLILQGSADFQVYADKNYTLWQTVLKNRNNVTFHLYEGLSHEFMPNQISKNGAPDITVYNAPNHVEPQVIKDIALWIRKVSK